MFDKTITLISSDASVTLAVKAGTEGVRSLVIRSGDAWQSVTAQQLMDICAPAIKAWFEAQNKS